jgi:hypothetical protein
MTSVLRCRDLEDAVLTVAALYRISPDELERVLPVAAQRAQEDRDDPIGALPVTLAASLGRNPATPARIHYFHGTRAADPSRFLREGLRPLGQVLDSLWEEVGALVPELSADELRGLRSDLTADQISPHTYSLRVENDLDQRPCGHLLRDMFLHPDDYASVDYLAGAEIVIDICQAIEERTGLDATVRYRQATTPCIVEFSVAATHFDQALAAALWYLEAGMRGERTMNGNWSYCADGEALPERAIVSAFGSRELRAGSRPHR